MKDRTLSGKARVRARHEEAQRKRDAIAAFVARTGAPLVDEDEYMRELSVSNEIRRQADTQHAFSGGKKPWLQSR